MDDNFLTELVGEFIGEAGEMLDDIEPRLIGLEDSFQSSGKLDQELLNEVFRAFHTIKGGAGSLGLDALSELTHEAETLLDMFRNNALRPEPAHTALLCESLDIIRCILAELKESGYAENFDQKALEMADKFRQMFDVKESSTTPDNKVAVQADAPPAKVKTISLDFNDSTDLLDTFAQECLELLDQAEQGLLKLDENENDLDSLAHIYRNVHSFKGNCGIFSFGKLERLGHLTETFIDKFREFPDQNNAPNRQLLLIVMDILRDGIEKAVYDKDKELLDVSSFIERLSGLLESSPEKSSEQEVQTEIKPAVSSENSNAGSLDSEQSLCVPANDSILTVEPLMSEKKIQKNGKKVLLVDDEEPILFFLHEIMQRGGFDVVFAKSVGEALSVLEKQGESLNMVITDIKMPGTNGVELVRKIRALYGNKPVIAVSAFAEKEECLELANLGVDGILEKPFESEALLQMVGEICKKHELRAQESAHEKVSKRNIRQIETKETIRVDLEKLDHLINLVGELVIAESMVTHNPDLADLELDNFDKASSHLNKIVRELQDVAMNIRMVPVSGLFKRMIRLVHDLARSADKQARIELIGEETEIDKTVIEMVSDPLVHIIRNAVDHGLESPEERQEKGKDAKGQIRLEARHEGGEVWILVSDDGRGLNRERILQRALERELITDGAVETMTDDQIYSLIFAPGFSTAEKITDVSGRGVGMDVVKQNIEKLNGRVSIRSFDGKGSTFVLRIPLTLAIIEGMIVRVGSSIYTIPILSIRESVRLQEGLITKTMNGEEVARIREELIPVMRLYELHGLEPDNRDLTEGILIIVEDGGHNLGLFVDEIVEQHQAVVKGLSSYIGNVRGIMGCTILGDGRISLILDIGRIVGKALHNETA